MKPVEGVTAAGGTWLQQYASRRCPRSAPISRATPCCASRSTSARSAMGFVGAGGIGKELLSSIRQFYYSDVSAILLMLIVTVFIIDTLTARLRHASSVRRPADAIPAAPPERERPKRLRTPIRMCSGQRSQPG